MNLALLGKLKRAYKVISENQKKYPAYIDNLKTLGLLHVIIGSVPQKYQWIVSLFGLEGSVDLGLSELESISLADNIFSTESAIIQSLVYTYLLGKQEQGVQTFNDIYAKESNNEFLAYLNMLLLAKNQQSEKASQILINFLNTDINIPTLYYLGGEINLQKGEYDEAIRLYKTYLESFKGKSNIKDAHYKIYLCAHLQNSDQAEKLKLVAQNTGERITESDKHASRILSLEEAPNPTIMKIRLFTDGGFYDQAEQLIEGQKNNFPNSKDKAEFEYRKARLAHQRNRFEKAEKFYLNTIQLSKSQNWYFGPNSCLLLAKLYQKQNDKNKAKIYYKKVFEFRNYEYQRSIENKAKRGLESLL